MTNLMSRDRLETLKTRCKADYNIHARAQAAKELAEWADRLMLFANLNPASRAAEAVATEAEELRTFLGA